MKTISRVISTVFFASILASHQTSAAPFYLTANAGISKLKSFCSNTASGFSCTDTSAAGGIDGGYQFNNMFGLELGYTYFGKPQSTGLLFGSNLEVSQEISGLRFSGTATLPLSSNFAFTGKLGLSRTMIEVQSKLTPGVSIPTYVAYSTAVNYGLGMKYNVTQNVALRLQYENLGTIGDTSIGTDNLSLLSLGVSVNYEKSRQRTNSKKSYAEQKSPSAKDTIRVILFLDHPPAADKQAMIAALAEACLCEPLYVRLHSTKAEIYQTTLATGQTFSAFKETLLASDSALGIKAIAQTN